MSMSKDMAEQQGQQLTEMLKSVPAPHPNLVEVWIFRSRRYSSCVSHVKFAASQTQTAPIRMN
ncbi:YjfB family protein [Paenibacillus lautus]|uniref:YjfB family protein n=1 Tax=Paenibacillus lautus TaxID=1401 RepID=UPI003D2B5F95